MHTTPQTTNWYKGKADQNDYARSNKVVCFLENGASHYDDLNSFLRLGHNVVVVTKDEASAEQINKGVFKKAGQHENRLRSGVETNRLSTANSLERALQNAEAIVLSDAPSNNLHAEEPSDNFRKSIIAVGSALYHATSFKTVIVRHVLRPSEMNEWIIPMLESASGKTCGDDFGLIYMPASSDMWENALCNSTVAYAATDEMSDGVFSTLFWALAPLLNRHSMSAIEAAGYMEAIWKMEKANFARKMAADTFRNVLRSSDVFDVLGDDHPMADENFRNAYTEQTLALDHLLTSIKNMGAESITFLGNGFLDQQNDPSIRFAHRLFDELNAQNFRLNVHDQRIQNAPSIPCDASHLTPSDQPKSGAWGGWASPSFKANDDQCIQSGLILLVNEPEGLNDLADRLGSDVSVLDLSLFFPCT